MGGSLSDGVSGWEERAAKKRAECEKKIPSEWKLSDSVLGALPRPLEKSKLNLIGLDVPRTSGILNERELDITEKYTVAELLHGLARAKFTAAEVTVAFSKRAAIAQQLTECLTEIMFDEALERARFLDDRRSNGQLVGPLHGLPVSIKDGFQLAGTQATLGLTAFLDRHSCTNAALVDVLLDLGAVLYVKTNVPQTLMTADSQNNIFGRVLNPHNTALTAGGSSGGEGALVAFRGSPLGVGTDIAGSIRIPASCCGTYGFKPTSARVPFGGQEFCANPGLRTIAPCAGPLANDFDALDIFMKAVLGADPATYDPGALHAPWRAEEASRVKPRLRLGIVPEDPAFPLHPPVKQSFVAAVGLLKKAGHEIIELSTDETNVNLLTEVGWGLFSLDSAARNTVLESGEPLIPFIKQIEDEVKHLPWNLEKDQKHLTDIEKLSSLNLLRAQLTAKWHGLWAKHKLDAVISPTTRSTAVEHDTFGVPPYTLFLNVLDYPAAVLPLGTVPDESDNTVFQEKPGQPAYNHELLKGAPLSIQVFTNRMRDEECMAAAFVVNECFRSLRM